MLPQIKVYKIDYEFIISNYLDVHLWDKQWTLLIYKEHHFTLSLKSINTQARKITFEIRKNGFYSNELVDYDMKSTSIKILKKQINGAMFRLMVSYEKTLIQESHEYVTIANAKYSERETLRNIARDFLDNEGITNEDVREAYIHHFVDKNETVWSRLAAFEEGVKYTVLPDLFITFCKITEDRDRLMTVMEHIGSRQRIKEIMVEVNSMLEKMETDDWYSEMREELEGI